MLRARQIGDHISPYWSYTPHISEEEAIKIDIREYHFSEHIRHTGKKKKIWKKILIKKFSAVDEKRIKTIQ